MCGIVGILSFDPERRVDPVRLRRMRDALRHRGPDGEGLYLERRVGLGHRRLAIVDPAGGRQPMANEDQDVFITFNGEIYNHAALRPELERRGHRYASRSDTETIVHLYEEEGAACVGRLQGMFAFAVWDRGNERLLLARDRLGIKPLYYAERDGELLFASEIKAILAAGVRPVLNEEVLPEYLANRYVAGRATWFRDIVELPPGTVLSWSPQSGIEERRYWSLPDAEPDRGESRDARAGELRRRLREAVSSHLMSDVPLGVFLSGGLDSSGLLALMAPLSREPVRSFAVGFAEREACELPYARLAARAAGAEHREVVVSSSQFFAELPRLVWHEDEPLAFPSSVPLFFVSRLARSHVKVVLTGEGADELFLGYNRYRLTAWNGRLGRAYWGLLPAPVRREVARLVRGLPRSLGRYLGRSFLVLEPAARSLFCENLAVFSQGLRERILARPELLLRDAHVETLRRYEEGGGEDLERMSRADLQTYLVRLLMKQDQMSMAASIESRVPYLDHLLVEHVARLPASAKLRGLETKAVLRDALRGLVPEPILRRSKMGFPVPVGRWLRGRHSGVVEEFVLGPRARARRLFDPHVLNALAREHRSGRADHGDRLWLLVNLEIWQRLFLDGEAVTPSEHAA